MIRSEPAPTLDRHTPSSVCSAGPVLGITVYGCDDGEAALFREMAPGLGVVPTITGRPVCEGNIGLAGGNRCISIDHKTTVTNATLLALSEAGVTYISTRSVGCDHIDARYAEAVGICVETVAYSPDSVADYALMLVLMAVRHAKAVISRADARDYRLHPERGRELRDLTVGVIGTGRIGAAVIERLRGFGCRVLAHDRRPKVAADYVPLGELLRRSDVVTLHTPLTAATCHLLDRVRIQQMKHGAVVINTGRGALLDTEALLAALEGGRLGGAALDVVEGEEGIFYADRSGRPIESSLLTRLQALPNVIVTPHTAYYTEHALRDMVEQTMASCLRFTRERRHA